MTGRRSAFQPHSSHPLRALVAGLLSSLVIAAGLTPSIVRAQVLDGNLWVTDGDVNTIVPWGNTIYIGGNFAYVGPNTGGWTAIDVGGHASTALPRVDGNVNAMVSDGSGGWFIGGTFNRVAGIAHTNLAHVLANGSVAAWAPTPAPSGDITALERAGTRVFVATDAGELKAYDEATGAAIGGWTPQVTGTTSSLAVYGTTLFVAGDLNFQITGSASYGTGIAAVNTSTGSIDNWDPAPDAPVTKIQVDGRWLYVTGSFTDIGGQAHSSLARALLSTKVFDSGWNPSVEQPVSAMVTAASGFWIGGEFYFVNGEFKDRIAVVDTTTGATVGVAPNLAAVDGPVRALAASGAWVYLGISPQLTYPIGGTAKPMVLRANVGNGQLDAGYRVLGTAEPGGVGAVRSIRPSSTGLVISGSFITAGGRRQVAIAEVDRNTGIPRGWDPALAVDEAFPIVPNVVAIAPAGRTVYIGGYFTHAGGVLRKSVAALDSATAQAKAWQADLGPSGATVAGTANALAVYQDKLIVGGLFNTISGVSHVNLAEVDTTVGTPVGGWSCDAAGSVMCLLVKSGTVFVGGGISSVGGQSRSNIAAVYASTGAVLSWNPNVAGINVASLVTRNDTLYIGGDYSQVSGQTRICLAAVSATSGTLLGWAPSAYGPVRALVIDGPDILVGGEFTFQPANYLAKLDRFTGATGTGMPSVDANVWSLAGSAGSLYLGGQFGPVADRVSSHFAHTGAPDLAGPTVVVVAANGGETLVIGSTYRFEYTATDPSGVASVDIELSRAGSGGPFVTLASGLPNTGDYEWLVTAPAAAGSAFLRVTARDFAGNPANDKSNAGFTIGSAVASVDPGLERGALVTFALGPNPANVRTDLRFTLRHPMRAGFRLLDLQGRQVWGSPERAYEAGDHVLPCDLETVRPGLYFLRFEHEAGTTTTRLAVFR
jgi:hypothetical protein